MPIKIILSLFLVLSFSNMSIQAQERNELVLGSVAMDIPAVMHARLRPLTTYLSKELGVAVNLKLSPNMGAAINEAANANVDLAYLTPVAYLKAHDKGNAKIIAKTVTNGKSSFQLMIVVKEDSPIKTIEDLVGKSFAFGDPKALLQRAVVVNSGIELEQFKDYKFIGHYDNIARAVAIGDFDAGILKDTTAFKWQNKGLRILYRSPDLPPYNIAVTSRVSDDMANKLKNAFLKLDGKTPEHLQVIKALDKKYDGFADTSDAEYDIVRKLIVPFNK